MEKIINYYDILGVSRTASEEEIRKAYRTLSKKFHPDIKKDDGEIQRALNIAYETLKNSEKRKEYDKKLSDPEKARTQQNYTYETPGTKSNETASNKKTTSNSSANERTEKTSKTTKDTMKEEAKGRYEKTSEPKRNFFEDIRTSWKEIKEEEKDCLSFFKLHRTLSRNIHRKLHVKNGTPADEFIFIIRGGAIHISAEVLRQIDKLSYITKDSIPKYLMRNRGLIAATALAAILIAGANSAKKEEPHVDMQSQVQTQMTTPVETGPSIDINDNSVEFNHEEPKEEITEYVVSRVYTVEPNDTLSELAVDANSTVSEIQARNGLNSTLIKIGETLIIPYHIAPEDLKYAAYAVYYPTGMSIEDFAKRYNTTADSIITLNEDAIEEGQVLSDTLLIPNFANQKTISTQKQENGKVTYTK